MVQFTLQPDGGAWVKRLQLYLKDKCYWVNPPNKLVSSKVKIDRALENWFKEYTLHSFLEKKAHFIGDIIKTIQTINIPNTRHTGDICCRQNYDEWKVAYGWKCYAYAMEMCVKTLPGSQKKMDHLGFWTLLFPNYAAITWHFIPSQLGISKSGKIYKQPPSRHTMCWGAVES